MDTSEPKKDNSGWIAIIMIGFFFLAYYIVKNIFSDPAPVNEYSYTPQTDPVVNCSFDNCGSKLMLQSACNLARCCPVGTTWIITRDANSCTNLQNTLISIRNSSTSHSTESGHEAGYQWASDNDIDSTSYCDTPSDSFNEGCASYVCEMSYDFPDDYECY